MSQKAEEEKVFLFVSTYRDNSGEGIHLILVKDTVDILVFN